MAEITPEVAALLARFSVEEQAILMQAIAKPAKSKTPSAPKELPPELVAAQTALNEFLSDKSVQDIVNEYNRLNDEVAKWKKTVRVKLSTKQYNFTPESGDNGIYDRETSSLVCTFGIEGWNKEFLTHGFTHGQLQAIYKHISKVKKDIANA